MIYILIVALVLMLLWMVKTLILFRMFIQRFGWTKKGLARAVFFSVGDTFAILSYFLMPSKRFAAFYYDALSSHLEPSYSEMLEYVRNNATE